MALRGVDLLLGEIEKAKDSLDNIDKTIAKLTGRNPNEPAPRPGQKRNSGYGADLVGEISGDQARSYNKGRRGFTGDEGPIKRRLTEIAGGRRRIQSDGPPAKRRPSGGAFSRLGPMVASSRVGPRDDVNSGDEEELAKHTVHSSVVANPVSKLSREEMLEISGKDQENKQRNKRMFGVLMGTLQRFKQEEKQLSDKEAKRKAVEQKLEMKAKQELENIKKERRKLFLVKQKKEQKIRRLEQKVELVKIHEEWAQQTKMLGNFVRTKARPHLYYAPKTHTSGSTTRLKGTKDLLEKIIKDRRKQLEEEIEELMREEEEGEQTEEPAEQPVDKRNVVEQERGKGDNRKRDKKQAETRKKVIDEVMEDEEESSKGNKENEVGDDKEARDVDRVKDVDQKERDSELAEVGEKLERERKDSKGDERRSSSSSSSSRQSRSHRTSESDKGTKEKERSPHHGSFSRQDDDEEGVEMSNEKSSSNREKPGNKVDDKQAAPSDSDLKDGVHTQLNGKGENFNGSGGEVNRGEPLSEEYRDVNNVEEDSRNENDETKQ